MWLRALALTISATLASAAEPEADRMADIVRLHIAAIGGQERIDALQAYRAEGRMGGDSPVTRFTMLAARPARLRMEFRHEEGTVIQAFDGASPPWQSITRRGAPAETGPMPAAEAAAFTADAIYDNPLVAGARLGYQMSFAGEAKVEERALLRVRIAVASSSHVFFLLIDPDTHLIALRIDPPQPASGAQGSLVTRYEDFRPVAGVLVPHEITVHSGGKPARWARIDRIEVNPTLPPGAFTAPAPP